MGTYLGFAIHTKYIAYCAIRNSNISKIGILQLKGANVHNDIATTCQLLRNKLMDSTVLTGIEKKKEREHKIDRAIERCRIATILECQVNQTFNCKAKHIDPVQARKSVSNDYKVKIISRDDLHNFVTANISVFPRMEELEFNQGLSDAWATAQCVRSDHNREQMMDDPVIIERLSNRLENDRIIASLRKSIDLTTDEKVIANLNEIIESRRTKLFNKWLS